ncbi:MAG: hydantoinase B/oxoprolinase family protein, partial [Chloroflexi bacterium]|nr:hydantoinase B/oxoprolinase family protein [Chloroflexota bacterium]
SPDMGGALWSADAREVFEEGLGLPPLKVVKEGRVNEELIAIIRHNVRVPDQVMGDLFAQIAAGDVCADRLKDFMQEQGLADLTSLGAQIQALADGTMRRAIAELPDGSWEHTVYMDGFDQPIKIQCRVTIRGDEIEVDYEGTSPQVDRGINSVMNYTWAYTCYPVKCAIDPHTAKNEGSYRAITVKAPEGSILNPRYPAPVNSRQIVGHMLTGAIFGCLAQVIPERVIADSGSAPTLRTVYSGIGRHGERFGFILFANGGMGARPNQDGLPCTPFPTNSTCASIEVMEGLTPLLVRTKRIRPDSGGAGKWRGGYGQEIIVECRAERPISLSVISDRQQFPPQGMVGGEPGSSAVIKYLNREDRVHPKSRTTLNPGDVLYCAYPGGGGYGPPSERDPELVRQDLENGVISEEAAYTLYQLGAG